MANPEHVKLVQQKDWNNWRADHPDVIPNLSGADLSRYDLPNRANRYGARLSDLYDANLTGADLRQANLNGGPERRESQRGEPWMDSVREC
jgi:Pentapeptide repeats (8 copies)